MDFIRDHSECRMKVCRALSGRGLQLMEQQLKDQITSDVFGLRSPYFGSTLATAADNIVRVDVHDADCCHAVYPHYLWGDDFPGLPNCRRTLGPYYARRNTFRCTSNFWTCCGFFVHSAFGIHGHRSQVSCWAATEMAKVDWV
eukprot:6382963-Amphidinium_carterae.1